MNVKYEMPVRHPSADTEETLAIWWPINILTLSLNDPLCTGKAFSDQCLLLFT
jgi:hypothetical protein